ncbi:MAG: hypothetical protein ABSH51_30195 [Solirubrobacteraceae bacterium]
MAKGLRLAHEQLGLQLLPTVPPGSDGPAGSGTLRVTVTVGWLMTD